MLEPPGKGIVVWTLRCGDEDAYFGETEDLVASIMVMVVISAMRAIVVTATASIAIRSTIAIAAVITIPIAAMIPIPIGRHANHAITIAIRTTAPIWSPMKSDTSAPSHQRNVAGGSG